MHRLALVPVLLFAVGCADDPTATSDLAHRAYVVSQQSDELTVIDTEQHTVIGQVATGGIANHMAEISADLGKVFVVSSETNQVIVVDARTLAVTRRIPVAGHPTHVSLSPDGGLLALVCEDTGEVAFLDPVAEREVARIEGLVTPHFVRWSHDLGSAYVANIGGHHITRIDLDQMAIAEEIVLDGFDTGTPAPGEGGFADVQIDHDGVLWAAHSATSRVLVYDTVAGEKLAELEVGAQPWIAFAEHPFEDLPRRTLVPSFGDRSVTLIDGPSREVVAAVSGADQVVVIDPESEQVTAVIDGVGRYPWSVTIPGGQNYCH